MLIYIEQIDSKYFLILWDQDYVETALGIFESLTQEL